MTVDEIAQQIKVPQLFGTVGVDEVGIRWKDNALIRGGLTDMMIRFFYVTHGAKLEGGKLYLLINFIERPLNLVTKLVLLF